MTAVETADVAHDDHHAHGEFIAHHFDTPQQQFDSGKLGIWLFLVTEILFFTGLFCAYTLYRAHHPEIFVEASTFLDKVLGGINTIVLLFSSLTMALAVRSTQLVERKKIIIYLIITMVCAAIFLGIKAVEYSHKWDEGIFVRGYFHLHEHVDHGLSRYLILFSIPFAIGLVASLGSSLYFKSVGKQHLFVFWLGVAIMFGGYFLGAVGGKVYMSAKTGSEQAALNKALAEEKSESAENKIIAAGGTEAKEATSLDKLGVDTSSEQHATIFPQPEISHDIGIFFSIYYCMTGLHAFHVIGGMIFLSWLLYRSILQHWRADYYGPVEYVGLYWHLVDLIWIFLFPLLYLIN